MYTSQKKNKNKKINKFIIYFYKIPKKRLWTQFYPQK